MIYIIYYFYKMCFKFIIWMINPMISLIEHDNDDEENQLADVIENNKAALAKQFNLINPTVSWNAEGEPVMMTDDNDEQVDFIKAEDWENNQGFYSRSNTMGEITLDGIDIIYVVNPY